MQIMCIVRTSRPPLDPAHRRTREILGLNNEEIEALCKEGVLT